MKMAITAKTMNRKLGEFIIRQVALLNRALGYDENDRLKYNAEFIIEILDSEHLELRTDEVVYNMFYSPMTSDNPEFFDKFHTKFHNFVEMLGWSAEPRGQGIIDLYRD